MCAFASLSALGRRLPALARLRPPAAALRPLAAPAAARLRPLAAVGARSSSGGASSSSPLFDLPADAALKVAPAAVDAAAAANGGPRSREAVAFYRNLPVSPKKLRVVARMAPGLYWREAMAQLEFCRKNMAVMVKNAISSAAGNAEHKGLNRDRLVVSARAPRRPACPPAPLLRLASPTCAASARAETVTVGKGSYFSKPDPKNKGRFGIRKVYFSHLRVTLKEVSVAQVQRTKDYVRWHKAAELLAEPWEERVKRLPRYRRPVGYDPTGEGQPPPTPGEEEEGGVGAAGTSA
jgi:large subunit ribosomal protein L22